MTQQRNPILWQKLKNDYVMCNICPNRCVIKPGEVSRCFSRKNLDGEMELLNYSVISSLAVDPIEKKPLYHFYPFSSVLSAGTFGCNFACKHCQNWEISQIRQNESTRLPLNITSEAFVDLAIEQGCQGIAWTYNEPTIWLEYTLDCAKIAKERGLYTVYVTNGFITNEALEVIAPYLDSYRVDLKSFDVEFYKNICGVNSIKQVYDSAKYAFDMGLHVECVTNIIPTFNDSDDNLRNIAMWILENLSESVPWHVTRFFPYHNLSYLPPTPVETIQKAYNIGKDVGLEYIYKGNLGEVENTHCPVCSATIINREKQKLENIDDNNSCEICSHKIYIRR